MKKLLMILMTVMVTTLAADAQVKPTVLGDKHAMLKVDQGEKYLLLPVQESEDIAAIAVLIGQNEMVQRLNVKLASDRGDLRYQLTLDNQAPIVISLKEPYRSEQWKQNVLRCQALKQTAVKLTKGHHTLKINALDNHIIADQWMIDFNANRHFYTIP